MTLTPAEYKTTGDHQISFKVWNRVTSDLVQPDTLEILRPILNADVTVDTTLVEPGDPVNFTITIELGSRVTLDFSCDLDGHTVSTTSLIGVGIRFLKMQQ